MRLEAKDRLLADDKREKRNEIQDKIDNVQKKVEQLKKALPSKINKMKVTPENQVIKRQQILKEKMKIQELRKQKLRYKED